MASAMHSVTIGRPIETVFAFVAAGENGARWRPGVIEVERTSGEGLGARYAQVVKGPMGRRIAADYEVTAYDPPRRLEFRTIAGPVRPAGSYELEAAEEGTRLTFALQVELSGLRRLLLERMVQATIDAEVRNLEDLKRILEA